MSTPVFFVAHFTVTDPDEYRIYEKGFFPVLKGYDAQFMTFDDDVMVLEGEREEGRTVVIQFASEEECLRWWNSDEYKAIVPHRHAGTTSHSVSIVHGMAPRG
ncbi:MAG: DUF1330 domain-containing protein [Actinomycetota bacterium]